ncbi:hypothetical protein HID58_073872 [Brassica napus]|uniref:Uncharacterized protein n=1 Tax=Brassica napus TaxID=3708 RepID=A0ABQ7YIA6_BRANA|nr:hypothetical protein HID58_073872 [Brassica napus]
MDARDELEARRRSRSSRDTVSRRYLSEDPKRGREDHHSQTSRSSYHRDTNLHHHEVNSGPRDLRRDLSDRYLSRDRSLQTSRHRDSVTSAREESPPRQSRSNQNRGIPLEEIQASVPKEVFNAAVGEVREAMMQYTQCNDPTESAARRERMRRAEEEGEMEETAALMIQAKMTAPTDTVKTPEQQPSRERVPATLRLGPIAPSTQEPAPKVIKEAGKRKPGRPPSKRTVQGSPKLIRGSTSKKRKTHQDKPTATRRKLNQDSAQGNPQKSNSKPSSSRGWEVGNGSSINIWEKPWLSFSTQLRPMGPPPREFSQLTVSDLMLPDRNEWDIDMIQRVLPFEEQRILAIKPSRVGYSYCETGNRMEIVWVDSNL